MSWHVFMKTLICMTYTLTKFSEKKALGKYSFYIVYEQFENQNGLLIQSCKISSSKNQKKIPISLSAIIRNI